MQQRSKMEDWVPCIVEESLELLETVMKSHLAGDHFHTYCNTGPLTRATLFILSLTRRQSKATYWVRYIKLSSIKHQHPRESRACKLVPQLHPPLLLRMDAPLLRSSDLAALFGHRHRYPSTEI